MSPRPPNQDYMWYPSPNGRYEPTNLPNHPTGAPSPSTSKPPYQPTRDASSYASHHVNTTQPPPQVAYGASYRDSSPSVTMQPISPAVSAYPPPQPWGDGIPPPLPLTPRPEMPHMQAANLQSLQPRIPQDLPRRKPVPTSPFQDSTPGKENRLAPPLPPRSHGLPVVKPALPPRPSAVALNNENDGLEITKAPGLYPFPHHQNSANTNPNNLGWDIHRQHGQETVKPNAPIPAALPYLPNTLASDQTSTIATPALFQHERTAATSDLGQVTERLGDLNLTPSPVSSFTLDSISEVEFPFVQLLEPRPGGEPNDTLQECPGSRLVDYTTSWYHASAVPEALICTNCFRKYIAGSELRGEFFKTERPEGRCRFNVPRILLYLWPQAQQTGSLSKFEEYLANRLQILNCKGFQGVQNHEGFKFFSPTSEPPKGFVACEACYEENVLGSPLAEKFAPTPYPLKPGVTWYCCFSGAYVARSLRHSAVLADGWNIWASEANKRIFLPVCENKPSPSTSRRWFALRGLEEVYVCEACYLDYAAKTRFEDMLRPKVPALGTMCLCDFKSIPVRVAWAAGLGSRDFSPVWKTAAMLAANHYCTPNGKKGGEWYFLKGSNADFCLCAVCYTGIIQALKAERYFERKVVGADRMLVCDFTLGGPRTVEYIQRFSEAVETGVWSRFSSYVDKWSRNPLCPKDRLGPGAFYGFGKGFPDIAACKKCYEDVIMKSPFDSQIVFRGEVEFSGKPLKAICSFFSERMRAKWAETCRSGDLESFIAFATMRVKVWCETIPTWEVLLARQQIASQTAMTYALASVAYQGAENITLAARTHHSDMRYGSSSLGWHETQSGAMAAQSNQNMVAGFAQAANGNVLATMAQLEQRWKTVM